jgi:hypothetical protein
MGFPLIFYGLDEPHRIVAEGSHEPFTRQRTQQDAGFRLSSDERKPCQLKADDWQKGYLGVRLRVRRCLRANLPGAWHRAFLLRPRKRLDSKF